MPTVGDLVERAGSVASLDDETPSLQKIAGEFFNVPPYDLASRCDAERTALVRNMLFSAIPMDAEACVKVVMKPGAITSHHTEPPASRQQ
jgi:hypothetical protein